MIDKMSRLISVLVTLWLIRYIPKNIGIIKYIVIVLFICIGSATFFALLSEKLGG